MSKPKTFSEHVAASAELRSIDARDQKAKSHNASLVSRIAELERRTANEPAGIHAQASAIASGADPGAVPSMAGVRIELEECHACHRASELALQMLEKEREACMLRLVESYVPVRMDEHRARVERIFDALLTVSEVNHSERAFRAELMAEGFPAHHFPKVEFPVNHGPFGGWHTDALHLADLIKKYGAAVGFEPSADQRRRLAALGG